jgi:hypothetical protein
MATIDLVGCDAERTPAHALDARSATVRGYRNLDSPGNAGLEHAGQRNPVQRRGGESADDGVRTEEPEYQCASIA